MPATLDVESTLTDRYQTTVPETVRRALGLGKRDKLHYSIRPTGEVVLTRADDAAAADPVLERFLDFLAQNHQRFRPVEAGLVQRAHALVGDVEVDLDAALPAEDE